MQISDPDRLLALAYAGKRREKLYVLFALDEHLGRLIATTREPVLAQMKLAWWRENLSAGDTVISKGEPLLASIHEQGLTAGLADLVNGWEAILGDLPLANQALDSFASGRGGSLFAAAMALYGQTPNAASLSAGRIWALTDFAFRCSDRETRDRALAMAAAPTDPARLPRPLGILRGLAKSDVARGPLHRWQPGSPMRMFRAFGCALGIIASRG